MSPAIRALRPFALAGYTAAKRDLAPDTQVGVLCGVPIYARDLQQALEIVSAATPVRTLRQRRWTRLKAAVALSLPEAKRRP